MVDKEKVKGKIEQLQGKVEQAVGKGTGSEKTQARGRAHEAEGKVREKVADVKGKVRGLCTRPGRRSPKSRAKPVRSVQYIHRSRSATNRMVRSWANLDRCYFHRVLSHWRIEMINRDTDTLSKLSDTNLSVKAPDEDIRGRTVKDKDGNDVGKVDDLLIDGRDQKVRFMQVESGGFLGLGETKSFIPVDAITRITDDEVYINQSCSHVAGAPRYDPGFAERDYYGSLYGYYGYPPYWGAF